MKPKKNFHFLGVLLLSLLSCAGMERSCASCTAESFGADWIVVQYRNDGAPIACWQLTNTSISNEDRSDGVYWKSPNGHLIHLSGWYNRVQVDKGDFKVAASDLGIDIDRCVGGKYADLK
jgi:hypothetical protein